jgi:phosphatidate cytidylyltransferase
VADDEGREGTREGSREEPREEPREDIFEDLDKFFAPIKDVDWPGSAGEEQAEGSEDEPEPSAHEHVEVLGPRGPEAGDEEDVEPPAAAEAEEPAGHALFPEIADGEADEEAAAAAEERITVEAMTQPPPEYRDLPGPRDEESAFGGAEDEEVSLQGGEPDEGEEEPSPASVEAAAEHFAASVRDEGTSWEDLSPSGADEGFEEEDLYEPEAVEEDILSDLGSEPAGPRTVMVGSGEYSGPTWQDPTAPEIALGSERVTGQRDVPAAFLTGVVLAALAVGALAIDEAVFAVVAAAVALFAQGELYAVLHRRHFQPATALGLVSGGLVLAAAYLRGEPAMLAMLALSLLCTVLWFIAVPAGHRKNTSANIGLTLLGVVYVPLLAGYALATLDLPDGKVLLLAVVALTFVYDTAAFLFGSLWGGSFFQRPMAPTVSPRKTWEGAIAAALLVVGISVAFVSSYVDAFEGEPLKALMLAVVVVIAATIGDLAESLLKRDLEVKDMGSVLPGHGGVLDRIDSLLFVAPAAFLFFRAVL